MARPVHELLLRPLLLAVVCLLLLQVSECSTPPPPPPSSPGNDHVDAPGLHRQLLLDAAEVRTAGPPTSTEVAGDERRRTGADDAATAVAPSSASATTMPARAVGAAVASSRPRQTSDDRALGQAEMLLRSKLARRFLVGAGVDEAASSTDGAAPSCRSNNPHTNCPPASKP